MPGTMVTGIFKAIQFTILKGHILVFPSMSQPLKNTPNTHQPRWPAALNRAASIPLVDSLMTCPGPNRVLTLQGFHDWTILKNPSVIIFSVKKHQPVLLLSHTVFDAVSNLFVEVSNYIFKWKPETITRKILLLLTKVVIMILLNQWYPTTAPRSTSAPPPKNLGFMAGLFLKVR